MTLCKKKTLIPISLGFFYQLKLILDEMFHITCTSFNAILKRSKSKWSKNAILCRMVTV